MEQHNNKTIITLTFSSLVLLSTGCVPKNADGTYSSAYSYHPYAQSSTKITQLQRTNYNTSYDNFHVNTSKNLYRIEVNIANKIEKDALQLLGTDYKYGANGPYQYDCSSFTKHVFAKQGIDLPRVSRDQAKEGVYLTKNQLQKGDLVFFDSRKSDVVSHVGIYLGHGKFIHASSKEDQVAITSINSNYYTKHFKWGRRVTNQSYAMK
jgi:cell wall-associated NlpC family hydrolase